MRGMVFAVTVLLFLFAGPLHLSAQGIGAAAVFGEVRDDQGQPVPSANVALSFTTTGSTIQTVTDPDGRFQLVNLRPGGPYTLTVTALGYAQHERREIELRADQRLQLDVTLSQQPIALEGIDVTLDRRFEISRAGPAITVVREMIQTLPTIDRSMMELTALSPVAVETSDEGGVSISGQNPLQNTILIDGALNKDVFGASSASGMPGAAARAKPIPLDAIEEFRVEVAPFDTRTSGFTGGALHAITRSGTNQWEASAFGHFRNESFFGDLAVDGANVAPDEFRQGVLGFTVGGALQPDVAHLFVAAEIEERTEPAPGFSLGVHEDIRTRIAADSLNRFRSILQEDHGIDAGTADQVVLENPLANVFTRLDARLGGDHTLTLRHNYARAHRDSTPNRASFGAYELSSTGHRIQSSNHSANARLFSRFGDGHSNDLSLNVQRIDDRSDPNSSFPQVDVRIGSTFEDAGFTRRARAGSRYFRQYDELDQTVVGLTDALTLSRGDIVTTLGAGLDYFGFDQDHRPGYRGLYSFNSLRSLEANEPSYYEVNVLREEREWTNRFHVVQPSLFVQNEHRFSPDFGLQYGLRLDVPVFPDAPEANIELLDIFGIRTDRLPSAAFLLSPRMGFNWQSQGSWTTQVRGGWGIFTGRVPFVWMADARRHTGLRSVILTCEGDAAPPMDPGSPAPQACADGTDASERQGTVVFFDREFSYPRELKVTAAVDQGLPRDFYVSAEAFMVQTFGRTQVRDLNIPSPGTSSDARYVDAFGLRANYGTPTSLGYAPRRVDPRFSEVLMIENDQRTAFAWAFTFEVQKRSPWLDLTASGTVSSTDDRQSLIFPDMLSNYASSPVGRQVAELGPAPANFDRPWKYVVSARGRIPDRWGGAELSVLYVGQSGQPYSYVYGSDINGDGYNGPGTGLDASNDLVFIPENPAILPATVTTRSLLAQLADRVDPCLADVRAAIVSRNRCRAPSTHRVDLRIAQPIRFGGVEAELTADVLNVLNLVDSEWGRVWEVDPLVPLLDIVARTDRDESGEYIPTSAPVLGYQGGVVRDTGGGVRPTLPFNLILPASQWQAQVGLRLNF